MFCQKSFCATTVTKLVQTGTLVRALCILLTLMFPPVLIAYQVLCTHQFPSEIVGNHPYSKTVFRGFHQGKHCIWFFRFFIYKYCTAEQASLFFVPFSKTNAAYFYVCLAVPVSRLRVLELVTAYRNKKTHPLMCLM